MTALKIIGIVLLCVLALICLLLACPIKAELRFVTGAPFSYKIRCLFIKYSSAKQEKDKKAEKSDKKKKDIKKTAETVFSVLKKIPYLLGHFSIDKLSIKCVCGSPDAAEAAIRYGAVCAVIYPLSAFISEKANCKKTPEVSVLADFNAQKDNYDIHLKLHTLLIFALITLLKISGDLIKKGETENAGKNQKSA